MDVHLTRRAKDEAREERVQMKIIMDAYEGR
jgi:hypothetical protein